jgi:hypothetical protein
VLTASLLLEDDLPEHRAGDVVARLGVGDDELLAGLHHAREVFQRDIGGGARVVEPAVGVFLDDRRFVACHRGFVLPPRRLGGRIGTKQGPGPAISQVR